MDYNYIISQVFTILAYVFLGVTYLTRKKNLILIFNAISTICFTISYIFLFAWSGVKMNTISLLRNLLIFLVAKFTSNSKNWKLFTLVTICGLIMVDLVLCFTINKGIFALNSVFDVVPYIATIIYTFAIWVEKGKLYKIFGVLSSVAWIVYNIFIHTLFGIILEAVMVICAIVGLVKHRKDDIKDMNQKGEI